MDSSQDFKSLQEKIQSALIATTRLTNQIAAEDLSFQRTSNPTVAEELDDTSSRLLDLTTSLLKSATKGTDAQAPTLEDADDIDVHWSRIVDVVDTLLEKADFALDEYTGAIKRRTAPTEQSAPPTKKPTTSLDRNLKYANVLKPQNAFELKPDNHDKLPWKPRLTSKPHAVLPLEKSLGTFSDENQSQQYKHPYESEIMSFEYPDTVFQESEPIPYQPFESTTATFVDTFEGVLLMLEELKGASEIAIDTEHHDFRTYTGLLSLMQISTREKDWIVDTLQPWRHKLEVLNEVFADPKIIKVLHGAYMDILWLQRDCGLYIVGLFDTYEAAVALGYPTRSLAYLLKRFVDFDADKKYQLADWRIRPLPEEMFYYARSDTHYLLYVYDMMRNELLQRQSSDNTEHNLMRQVLDRSKETSLRRHETYPYDSETGQGPFGWYTMLIRQSSGALSKEQFAVFRRLHQWRDGVARLEDESPLYVLGNPAIFDIARRLPPDPKALHSLIEPRYPLARREVSRLFDIITKAKVEGADGPSVADIIRKRSSPTTVGVGEVAKDVFPQLRASEGIVLSTSDLVSTRSQLFGQVAMSSRWEDGAGHISKTDLRFELPGARFLQSAEVVEESNKSIMEIGQGSMNEADLAHGTANGYAELESDESTLKTGLKRKAPEQDSEFDHDTAPEPKSAAVSDEEIAIPDMDASEDERRQLKKARKAEKKAEKRAQKKTEKAATKAGIASQGTADESAEEEAFDYGKAKSILNAKRASSKDTGAQKKFNPYALTAEGPKAARRMHGEKTGKSATFMK
ncbi:ribonuclease H-like domain-containing protein [Xylariaceae sp. FL0016]|nr:ribonuclease H-like domain-containing protein [Xylariaceae sp. FL0016]